QWWLRLRVWRSPRGREIGPAACDRVLHCIRRPEQPLEPAHHRGTLLAAGAPRHDTIVAVTASIWLYLTPLFVLGGLLLILGIFALLGRIQGGRYLKPTVQGLMKLPLGGRGMKKASTAAQERQNPEPPTALKKPARYGAS